MTSRACFDANLDVERRWAGAPPLPLAVRTRIAGLATLTRALAPDDVEEVCLRAPAPLEMGALPVSPGLPTLRPSACACAAEPAGAAWGARGGHARDGHGASWRERAWTARAPVDVARTVSDRRWALALAHELWPGGAGGVAVTSLDELRAAVAALGGPWIAKAVLTAAGRDRCGDARPLVEGELATRAGRLLTMFGALIVEPWLDRIDDVGACGVVASGTEIELLPAHRCHSGARGQFLGIELTPPPLTPAHAQAITETAALVGQRLAAAGYRGPFAIDAFTYRDAGGALALRPLVEVNPRYSFGHVAHALGARLGTTALAMTAAPPTRSATALAPGAWAY